MSLDQEEGSALKASYCCDLLKLRAFEEAFQPGDVRSLKTIRGLVQAATGPETCSDELGCLNRLLAVAMKIEAYESLFKEGIFYSKEPVDGVEGYRRGEHGVELVD